MVRGGQRTSTLLDICCGGGCPCDGPPSDGRQSSSSDKLWPSKSPARLRDHDVRLDHPDVKQMRSNANRIPVLQVARELSVENKQIAVQVSR